ncbi:MAG: histidine phosphatase family protein [Litorimonas sp.]
MTSHLTFIRHAHTVWNGPPKRFQGQNDVDLSDKGLKQCEQMQGELSWVKRIVASPAKRVNQTINKIFETTENPPPIVTNPNLWEIDNGYYGGKFTHEVKEQFPENYHQWMNTPGNARPGGGETLLDLLTRAILSIRMIRRGPIDGTLVATHGGIIRVLMLAEQNRSLNEFHQLTVDNLHMLKLSYEDLDRLEFYKI